MRLDRLFAYSDATIGCLKLGDKQWFTLEQVWRDYENGEQKVVGKSAIPAGTYKIRISYSARFKCNVPLLAGVPKFAGIEFHVGNTCNDTKGCILVGKMALIGGLMQRLTNSGDAFKELMAEIEACMKDNDLYVVIADHFM